LRTVFLGFDFFVFFLVDVDVALVDVAAALVDVDAVVEAVFVAFKLAHAFEAVALFGAAAAATVFSVSGAAAATVSADPSGGAALSAGSALCAELGGAG